MLDVLGGGKERESTVGLSCGSFMAYTQQILLHALYNCQWLQCWSWYLRTAICSTWTWSASLSKSLKKT